MSAFSWMEHPASCFGWALRIIAPSKLVDWAHEWLRADGKIAEISFPFSREPPADRKAYWTRLLPLIEPRSAIAIAGFDDPYPHWTIATNKSGPYSVRIFRI